ncbi:MAG: cytochrome ubiquinol oxidase subunit I [Thermoleophilia bacterium]|nr:cytochrome ubiquinol oxidase subunit I [Thermoleophilia bacterium]
MSFVFHIPLVCFGIAFPAIVLFTEGLWLRTGDATYKALAKRWSKVMMIFFAVGVVSGTILSFEFGILWPDFMATFGNVFGLAFGLEGFSFFVEAIFIAIYVYGWDRLPRRAHFASGIPIVIAGFVGSMMVIAVNGWMNNPVGFQMVNGVATDIRPWQALFNSYLWHELAHMYLAGYMVVGFIVAAVYAVAYMKGDRSRYVRAGLIIPLTVASLAAPVQVLVGDWAGRAVAEQQPLKLAAMEGLGHTEKGAPLTLGGLYDASTGKVKYGISVPNGLSLLATHDPNSTVRGLDSVPREDRPGPINTVRYAFATMVTIGTLLALLGVFYAAVWWRRARLPRGRWFYRAVVVAAPASVLALISGWIVTEVGRQPWIVYDVMRVKDAVTTAGGLPLVFAGVAAIYLSMTAIVVWLTRNLSRQPRPSDAVVVGEPA